MKTKAMAQFKSHLKFVIVFVDLYIEKDCEVSERKVQEKSKVASRQGHAFLFSGGPSSKGGDLLADHPL